MGWDGMGWDGRDYIHDGDVTMTGSDQWMPAMLCYAALLLTAKMRCDVMTVGWMSEEFSGNKDRKEGWMNE